MAELDARIGTALEKCTRPLSLAVMAVLVLGGFWFSNAHSKALPDGSFGCHTNNTGFRDFWIAAVKDGQLVAMEPVDGSLRVNAFLMDTKHGSGAFNVIINSSVTATCESED